MDSTVHTPRRPAILVAEDEIVVRSVVSNILDCAGYSVRVAQNGQNAFELCEAMDEPIDLAILDVVMPHIHGPELLKYLRGRWPKIPILFMSGFPAEQLDREALSSARFVPKPFTSAQLLRAVREELAWGRASACTEL